tara:strand:+ start:154 stop:1029 length:876 start_codon:yes stop_codon:yes gene_type:complete
MPKKKVQKKKKENYECLICNYRCEHKGNFNKHLLSNKHRVLSKKSEKMRDNIDNIDILEDEGAEDYVCRCGRRYRHRQSLYNHEQRCKVKEYPIENKKITTEELKPSYEELMGIITNLIPKVGNNNNNVINNNINIQLFLDEKCQDAMTIQNFANKLTLSIEDLLKERKMLGNVGNIVVENLKPIPLLKRPIHCTDVNNSTWMVHDAQEGWKKDDGKTLLNETGFGISKKFQALWDKTYPNWRTDTVLQQNYTYLVTQLSSDHQEKDIDNILQDLGSKCKLSAEEIKACLT